MRVIFAPTAKLDLLRIGEHIKQDNPARAVTFVEELIDRCYALIDMPRRYPLVPRYEHWGIRRCVHGDYLIFYRVRNEAVDIVHVLHGATDYESVLFPDA
jgi:addiction module RelE/StbE family toxin